LKEIKITSSQIQTLESEWEGFDDLSKSIYSEVVKITSSQIQTLESEWEGFDDLSKSIWLEFGKIIS
jgi:phage-related protein